MKQLIALAAALGLSVPACAETVAITGAKAWTMTEAAPVDDATILLRDGHVLSVTAGGAIPPGVRTISAGGRVVTPALVDAATQIGLGEVGAIAEERSASVDKGPLGASFDVEYAIDPNSQAVRQARADGVARALIYPNASASAPFAGIGAPRCDVRAGRRRRGCRGWRLTCRRLAAASQRA